MIAYKNWNENNVIKIHLDRNNLRGGEWRGGFVSKGGIFLECTANVVKCTRMNS